MKRRLSRAGIVGRRADGSLELVFEPAMPGAPQGSTCAGGGCSGCPARGAAARLQIGGTLLHASGLPDSGERFEVSVAAAGLARTALGTFGAPLAGLLAGAWLGQLGGAETWSIGCGVAGLTAGLAWVVRSGARLEALLEFELRRAAAPGAAMDPPARSRSLSFG